MGASLVQSATAVFADSAATQNVVFSAGTTAGTNVIVCVDGEYGGAVSAISGGAGTWTKRAGDTSGNSFSEIWEGTGLNAGTTTIAVTVSAPHNSGGALVPNPHIQAMEWSGLVTAGSYVSGSAGAQTVGQASITAGPAMPSNTGDVVIGAFGVIAETGSTSAVASPFTDLASGSPFAGSAYVVAPSTSPLTATWSAGGTATFTYAYAVFMPIVHPGGSVEATFQASESGVAGIPPAGAGVDASFAGAVSTSGGFSQADQVPWMLPVAINDHAYVMDFLKSRITTMQIRRQASDNSVEPGEQTLSAAGVWPRAQDNYFLGAGQEFLDNRFAFESVYVHSGEYPSVRTRFWKSFGLNPWSEGKMSLHNEYAALAISTVNLLIIACGTYLYRTDGANLYWTDNPVGVASPTWTQVTTSNTNAIVSLATDGSRVWFACGSQGVYVTPAGTTTVASAATPAALTNIGGLLAYAAGAGTLGAYLSGTVTYYVTKVDAFGNETAATSTGAITIGTTPINLNWQPDTIASAYRVYRGSTTLVYSGTDPSFVDDGTVQGSTATAPTANGTGSTAYPATFIKYAKGHLIGSTGRDLVEILASGSVSFIFQHENPAFVWTCGTECPSAILLGGYAGGTSFVGALQPDAATNGATLAPPTWATSLTPGEQINAISYDAGAILLGTNLGIRSGTKPDSTGAFDVNPVIEDPGSVLCVASWSQYEYFGWSNYDPSENWASRSTVSGLGRADLSQYTTPGVPAYATDVMGATAGTTTQVLVMLGTPYFVVRENGTYSLYGPDGKVVPSGWFEPGWIRYGSLENKIVVEVDFQHEPLPSGGSINYTIVAEDMSTINDIGTNSKAGSTTLQDPFAAGLMVGDRFMPIITLTAPTNQLTGPVFHSHITKAMTTTKRNDEILLALVWADEAQGPGEAPKTKWMDCWAEYEYIKGLEGTGNTVNLTMGSMVKVAYIDQVMLEPTDVNADRTFFQGTVTVKCITLT